MATGQDKACEFNGLGAEERREMKDHHRHLSFVMESHLMCVCARALFVAVQCRD